jgi:peptidoglycan/xylan/chitin deacetylase (PgdA/CDA1 family)
MELRVGVTRLRRAAPDETLVLCYHAVSDTWPADLAVTRAQLRRQLQWLVRRGYRGVTFSDALASTDAERKLVVTFDDAYLSVLEHAYPVLSSLDLMATVFAVTDYADTGRLLDWPGIGHWRGGPHEHELRGMTWDQLRGLADRGWEVGSHTRTHPRLTQVGDDELASELRDSRAACERALGRPCQSLAYPFGDFDARVAAAAGRAGYAVAAIEDLAPPEPLTWPRVGIYRGNSMRRFRLKVSPVVRRLRSRRVGAHA